MLLPAATVATEARPAVRKVALFRFTRSRRSVSESYEERLVGEEGRLGSRQTELQRRNLDFDFRRECEEADEEVSEWESES